MINSHLETIVAYCRYLYLKYTAVFNTTNRAHAALPVWTNSLTHLIRAPIPRVSNRNGYQEYFLGEKEACARADSLTSFMCRLSWGPRHPGTLWTCNMLFTSPPPYKFLMLPPPSLVCEHGVTMLWNQRAHLSEVATNRPNIIIRNEKQKICVMWDVAADTNVTQKEAEKKANTSVYVQLLNEFGTMSVWLHQDWLEQPE